MSTYTLPHFGELDISKLEEYYDVHIELDGTQIEIDLNFEDTTIDIKRMDSVKKIIEKIAEFDKLNKKYIEKDYNDEDADTVRTYIDHHLEEISKDELAGLVDFNNTSTTPEKQLMKALRLIRIGLYPDDEDEFAVFDYSIGRQLTDYLVVINTNKKGKLDHMTMES